MHERSLVEALLNQVERLMREQRAARVRVVRVSAGEFSGVEPELLRIAFVDLVDDSAVSGARLELEEVTLEAQCEDCGEEFAVERFRFQCPRCESRRIAIVRGEGLMLESVTMEFEE